MEYGEGELEFNWDEYLEDLGAAAAPHTSFKHVSPQVNTHRDIYLFVKTVN